MVQIYTYNALKPELGLQQIRRRPLWNGQTV